MIREEEHGIHGDKINLSPDWNNLNLWAYLCKQMIQGHSKHLKKGVNLCTRDQPTFEREFSTMNAKAKEEIEFWSNIKDICEYELYIITKKEDE